MAVTLFYLITGGLWILFSDRLLSLFVSAPPVLTFMQTIKGWFYVAITGGLLYVILRRWALEQERSLLLERSLRSIDDALIREKSLEEILGAVCDTVIGIGYPMCWLGLVEPDLAVRPVACRGLAPAALDRLQVSWEEVSSRRISRGTVNGTDEYLVYQDLRESGGHAPWLEEVRRLGYRSCASLPLRIHGQVLGVLNVGHRKRGAFSTHRLHTLLTIAQQATTVLYSARRREAFERLDYQHRLILNSVGDGILGVNREGIITFANRAVVEITRYDFNELFGQDLYEFLHSLKWNGTPCPREECKIFSAIKNGEVAREDDGLFWKKDGTAFPVEVTTAPIAEGNEVNGAVVVFKDISERKRYERQLAFLANHDPLTGFYNRYRFEEEVSAVLSRMRLRGIPGTMFFLDVDGFRSLNETLGHRAGDEIIVALAGVLKGMLHPGDILARPGSDEFVIFIIDEGHMRAGDLASDILDAVRQNVITVKGQLVGVTVSIGLAFFPEHGLSVEDLLSRAEMAMYRAKEKGRNQFYIFRPDETILQGVQQRLSWEKQIRRALEQDRFLLYFQPILDLRREEIHSYEALLRLQDERGEIIPPAVFLDTAERFGLICDIDRWVVRRAIQLIALWRKQGKDLTLNVNLSARAFSDPELFSLIYRELSLTGINPAQLILEITETATITSFRQAREFIGKLKTLGCRFALDDFGTGFSSFYYLKQLPVDYLKIDGSFIQNILHSHVDRQLVKAMVEMTRGLVKEIVAEFVENGETMKLLQDYGVDYAQGYYIGRPTGELVPDWLPDFPVCPAD